MGLVSDALGGSIRAIARLATHIENDDDIAADALELLYPRTGMARIIGVTGPPGAGKSTFVNALVRSFRANAATCAVIAVDPSSSRTGGATLGDRIRMLEHHEDPGVFVRSSASRGRSGGLAPSTFNLIHLFDAVGFDVVIIETVGVGQEEIDIIELAETVVLVQTPGYGDAVQTLKAGVLEIADIFVVNKSDLPGAHAAAKELSAMIALGAASTGWTPPVVNVTASTGDGLDRVAREVQRHAEWLRTSGEFEQRRKAFARHEVRRRLRHAIDQQIFSGATSTYAENVVADVGARRLTPSQGAKLLLESLSIVT